MGELDVSFKINPVFYVTMAFFDMLRSFRQNLELDEDQHGNSDYDGVLLLIAITHVAVLDPG